MIVSASELHGALESEDTLVIDARPFGEYAKGHVPGAVCVDLFTFHWVDTTREGIDAFTRHARTVFSMAGVSPQKRVVFYDGGAGMLAARGVWLLDYLSHPGSAMLDGGLPAWTAAGYETQADPVAPVPADFGGAAPDGSLIAGYEDVMRERASSVLIDARSPAEYSGKLVRAARGGHIPGAVHVDSAANLDARGMLKRGADLEALYDIPRDASIITYCHGAYRAALDYVALRTLGYGNVRVYLGSWGEWGNRPELPAEA